MINVDSIITEAINVVKGVAKDLSNTTKRKVTKAILSEITDPQSPVGHMYKTVAHLDKIAGYAGVAMAVVSVSSFIADIQYAAQQSVNEAKRGEKVTVKSFVNHAKEANRLIPEFSSERPDRTRLLQLMEEKQKEEIINGKKELQGEETLPKEGIQEYLQGTHFYSALQKTKRVSPVR